MNNYVVITENDHSKYNDLKGVKYHFPKDYLGFLLKGTNVIYYTGNKAKGSTIDRLSSKAHYFGIAKIENVYPDAELEDLYYADIVDFIPFKNAVSNKDSDGYFYETHKKVSGYDFYRGVREIDKELYTKLLTLAGITIKGEPSTQEDVSEESMLDIIEAPNMSLITIKQSNINPMKVSSEVNKNNKQFYAKNSKKVGDRGEEIVKKFLEESLPEVESSTIRWVASENEKPGYDLEYFDKENNHHCIEVKATTAKSFTEFILTINEWNAAIEKEFFEICLVTQCLSNTPEIYRLGNPAQLEKNNIISKEPYTFRIRLKS